MGVLTNASPDEIDGEMCEVQIDFNLLPRRPGTNATGGQKWTLVNTGIQD